MYKLPQSFHISACGGATRVSDFRTGMKDLTAFSGEKIGPHTWGKKTHAQFIRIEVFQSAHTRSGTGKQISAEQHSFTCVTII